MYIGLGDYSDSHLCMWWKRKKSLKYAFWGAILPSTLLFFTVGLILRTILYTHDSEENEKHRSELIDMTVAVSRLMLPGFALKILSQKEKTFACAINAHNFVLLT